VKVPRLLDGRLKFRHLILLDALSRQGSVVGAAAELHVTQPVATRGLHELEEILGVSLFLRGPRGITPTVFGEAFTHHARSVMAQIHQAGRHVRELAEADRGTVMVGTHLAGSGTLLPRAVVTIKARHPHLTVVIQEESPETLIADLEAGRIDFIVGRITRPSDERFERRTLYDETVSLVTGTSHPLACKQNVQLPALGEYPWILPGAETTLRKELELFFTRNDVRLPANRVEATSFLTVRQLLLETDAIAALPGLIFQDDARLTRLPVSLKAIGHSIGLVLPMTRPLNPPAHDLVECLMTAATKMRDSQ
jgi:DNA-binding transcriptional LysR family regulator